MTPTEPDHPDFGDLPYDETLDADGNPEVGPSIFELAEADRQWEEQQNA